MSDGHSGPDDKKQEGQAAPEPANEAEVNAAEAPVAEASEQPAAEKSAPKKRAPRKPKAAPETLATEQTEMAIEKPAAAKSAPKRAASKPVEPPPAGEAEEAENRGLFATLREPVVMWSVIGGAIVIVAALGYVGWTQFGHKAAPGSADALANRSVCEAALDRVMAYGVIPPAATLAQADADKTQVEQRVVCHAQAGGQQYALTVDVPCDDMAKDTCIKLYSVKQADGTSLFQRQM